MGPGPAGPPSLAHPQVADAFQREHGLRISFSFKQNGFAKNLLYLMEAGKKPSTDLDLDPAVYPPSLKPAEEIKAVQQSAKGSESRKRKRLSFDEVSNIILEGIGAGPIRTAKALEESARQLKHSGQVELWNYLGALKSSADTGALVAKVWRLQGDMAHPLWQSSPEHKIDAFSISGLKEVNEWRNEKWQSRVLILSGDGNFGKTSLGEALLSEKCPEGFWFLDDPDDFRELEGQLQPGQGVLIDEICLAGLTPNQIKKLFDVTKTRRVKCRHLNATLPKGCPRILTTNSPFDKFYPKIEDHNDRTGVFRRQLFQSLLQDARRITGQAASSPVVAESPVEGSWRSVLQDVCVKGFVDQYYEKACTAAANLGVALPHELVQVGQDIATAIGMKPLEQRRFLAQLAA